MYIDRNLHLLKGVYIMRIKQQFQKTGLSKFKKYFCWSFPVYLFCLAEHFVGAYKQLNW